MEPKLELAPPVPWTLNKMCWVPLSPGHATSLAWRPCPWVSHSLKPREGRWCDIHDHLLQAKSEGTKIALWRCNTLNISNTEIKALLSWLSCSVFVQPDSSSHRLKIVYVLRPRIVGSPGDRILGFSLTVIDWRPPWHTWHQANQQHSRPDHWSRTASLEPLNHLALFTCCLQPCVVVGELQTALQGYHRADTGLASTLWHVPGHKKTIFGYGFISHYAFFMVTRVPIYSKCALHASCSTLGRHWRFLRGSTGPVENHWFGPW